jgi:type II secretory pathway component PulF
MRETKAPLNMWMGDLLEELWCLPVLLWLAIALVLVLVTVRSRTRVRREVAVALPDIPIIGKARTERAAGG